MSSLTAFPPLRRTLTDAMEDQLLSNRMHYSPTLQQKLFRNTSALNSEEFLTIPELDSTQLSKTISNDRYYDVPEQATTVAPVAQIFNEFADPTLTTTNPSSFFQQQTPRYSPQTFIEQEQPPTKLLKFNEDLTLDYFYEDDDKFVVLPTAMSPNMIPEDIEDEELSDYDDDDEDFDLNNTTEPSSYGYLDSSILLDKPHLSFGDLPAGPHEEPHEESGAAGTNSLDIESDVDKMSLVSSDEENDEVNYSSNSSILDSDIDLKPSFQPQPFLQPRKKLISTRRQSVSADTSNVSNSEAIHQCHIINPTTGEECLKQFSRPYDLIRHQETIHAPRKKIFRCLACNKLAGGLSKKTFSRCDALSRHLKVKHGWTHEEAIEGVKWAKDNVEYVK